MAGSAPGGGPEVLDPTAAETRMVSRWRWLWLWAALAVAAIIIAFLAGTRVRSPWEHAISNSRAEPAITARVETRELPTEQTPLTGTVSLGAVRDVISRPTDGRDSIVTAVHAKVGTAVRPGAVIGEVSGRPMIALALPFPLYRDLAPGMRGPDVRAAQTALRTLGHYRGAVDGEYGLATGAAVTKLYRAAGMTEPDPPADALQARSDARKAYSAAQNGSDDAAVSSARAALAEAEMAAATPLPRAEIVTIAEAGATIVRVAPIGTVLTEELAVVAMRTGQPHIVARAGVDEVPSYPVRSAVTITQLDGSITAEGTIAAVGGFAPGGGEGKTEQVPGRDLTIAVDAGAGFADGAQVRITPRAAARGSRGLTAPLAAVRSDHTGNYVLRIPSGREPQDAVRVPVRVTATGDGYAALAPGALRQGDTVLISVGS